MQINSTTNTTLQYQNTIQSKQNETSTKSFKEELTKESSSNTLETIAETQAVEENAERLHGVLTYANTKGMSDAEVDKYFSEKTEEERSHIKSMIKISNNFSEDDTANEAIFMEARSKTTLKDRQEFSIQLATETMSFSLGAPTLNGPIEISAEYYAAKLAGVDNPQALGIYMNAAEQARYESGNFVGNYNETKFTSQEAGDFLSTMLKLAKGKMEQAEGTQVYDDYKEAYDRYQRINDNYNTLLAQNQENNKVDINA